MIQIRLLLADTLLFLAFRVGAKHWSTPTLLKFREFIETIKADLASEKKSLANR